jgi:hypothetical protein
MYCTVQYSTVIIPADPGSQIPVSYFVVCIKNELGIGNVFSKQEGENSIPEPRVLKLL